MVELPLAPLERILKEAGAARVSATGLKEFREVVETYAEAVGESAYEAAKHAGRKTVMKSDIQLVSK